MNDDRPTLLDLVQTLTKETPAYIERDHGKELRNRTGLLQQLRIAVFQGMENGGGASSFGSKPPIDAAAVDLLTEITDQAAQVLAKVTKIPTPYGHAETYVRLWSSSVTESQIFTIKSRATMDNAVDYAKANPGKPVVYDELTEITAYRLLERWIERIEDFFIPPKSREIPADCPNCGARYYHRSKDGETIRTAALNILCDRITGASTEARCSVCTRTWPRSQFGFLAELVGATETAPIVEKIAKEKVLVMSIACANGTDGLCTAVRCQCNCHLEEDHDPRLAEKKITTRV